MITVGSMNAAAATATYGMCVLSADGKSVETVFTGCRRSCLSAGIHRRFTPHDLLTRPGGAAIRGAEPPAVTRDHGRRPIVRGANGGQIDGVRERDARPAAAVGRHQHRSAAADQPA